VIRVSEYNCNGTPIHAQSTGEDDLVQIMKRRRLIGRNSLSQRYRRPCDHFQELQAGLPRHAHHAREVRARMIASLELNYTSEIRAPSQRTPDRRY
jgi:hypothetical protein